MRSRAARASVLPRMWRFTASSRRRSTAAIPLARQSGERSLSKTLQPRAASHWAIPEPMTPAPMTTTFRRSAAGFSGSRRLAPLAEEEEAEEVPGLGAGGELEEGPPLVLKALGMTDPNTPAGDLEGRGKRGVVPTTPRRDIALGLGPDRGNADSAVEEAAADEEALAPEEDAARGGPEVLGLHDLVHEVLPQGRGGGGGACPRG